MKNIIIGITCDYDSGNSRDSILIGRGCYYLPENYAQKVRDLGAIPVLISPSKSKAENRKLLSMLDGIILTGGRSIDPAFYGQEPKEDVGSLSMERYRREIPFLRLALKMKLPILGICAGHQALNVALGGTLHQNISSLKETKLCHLQQAPRKEAIHNVKIVKNTQLYRLVKKNKIRVNSLHQQAIDKLGKNVVITSKSSDGIIESIEVKGRKNVMGIQWHPESMDDKYSNKIFKNFVRHCK